MKKLFKTISTVLVAVLLTITSFAQTIHGLSGTETTVVTVEKLEVGDELKLYRIVEPDLTASGSLSEKGYKFANDNTGSPLPLVGPNDDVKLTVSVDNKTYKTTVKASVLDSDGDGKVDSTIAYKFDADQSVIAEEDKENTSATAATIPAATEWSLDSANPVSGYILYDMMEPKQEQIALVVKELFSGTTPKLNEYNPNSESKTVDTGTNYVQRTVNAGQYIGLITPSKDNDKTYNPVVLSAGYEGLTTFRDPDAGENADYYEKKDGTFTKTAPNDKTYHLYKNCVWVDGSAKKANAATEAYVPTKVQGNTTSDYLIAQNLSIPSNYDWYLTGSKAIAKSNTPGLEKEAETDTSESKREVPVLAVDTKGNEIVLDYKDQLIYIKAPLTYNQYLAALNDGKKFKLNATTGLYEESDASDAIGLNRTNLNKFVNGKTDNDAFVQENAAFVTTNVKEAITVPQEKVYTGGQGEEIRYTLNPTVPQYPLNSKNKTFVITDNLSEKLDYVEGSIEISFEKDRYIGADNGDYIKIVKKESGNVVDTQYVAKTADLATAYPGYEKADDKFYLKTNKYDVEKVLNNDGTYSFFVYESKGTYSTENNEGYYKGANNNWVDASITPPAPGTTIYAKNEFAKAKEFATGDTTNDNDFQINFKYDNLPGVEGAKESPIIKYKGVFTTNSIEGVEGNPNVAKVYYAKNTGEGNDWNFDNFDEPRGEDYNEWRDVKKVYTYELRFRKTNDKAEYVKLPIESTESTNIVYILKNWEAVEATTEYKNAMPDGKAAIEARWHELTSGNNVAPYNQAEILNYPSDGDINTMYITTQAKSTENPNAEYDQVIYTGARAKKNIGNPNPEDDFKTLAGAVFGVYSDSACKKLVTEVEVDKDGIGFTTKINGGEYYLKEITPPAGYSLSNEVYGPYKVDWTSATVVTTEGSTRWVYTADPTQAMDVDGDNNKPTATDLKIDATTKLAEDQIGWLIGSGENAPFYENQVYVISDNGDWTYNEGEHELTNKTDSTVVIANVYRAYLEKEVTTQTSGTATYYNNNGGTYDLNRIKNSKNPELPSTGGIGTYLFTIAGVAIIATAAFMLIFRKKEATR